LTKYASVAIGLMAVIGDRAFVYAMLDAYVL
jgi:hypothetical protein